MTGFLALVRLLLVAERASHVALAFNSLVVPALCGYFLSRLVPGEEWSWPARPAGALALALGGPVAQLGYECVRDRFAGRSALLEGTGAQSTAAYVAARLLVALVETLALMTLLLLAAAGLGAPVALSSIPGFLGLVGLTTVSLGAIAVTLAARSCDLYRGLALTSMGSMALAFVSPVFFPTESLAGPLRLMSWISPYTHMVEPFRQVLSGQTVGVSAVVGAAALCAAFLLVLATCITRVW